MSEELDTATRYRQHAEELRVIAAADRNRETRADLERIAENYERMAVTLEVID